MPLLSFFRDNMPSPGAIALGGPLCLIWAFSALSLAGWLKQKKGWKTGYTRKVFHFVTFITIAIIMSVPALGMPIVCLHGGMTSLVILYALVRGNGHPLYEAMAREKDAPHRTAYIVTPYLATLLGGLFGAIYFAPYAIAGFLVTGLGDAVGEPVGTRWGKHRYRVITATSTVSYRSYEGSLAVLLASLLCLVIAVAMSGALPWSLSLLYVLPLIALLCALVEAISPHGWDNFTMQVVPTVMCAWWIGN